MRFLIVGFGGFLGANARYFLSEWVHGRYGEAFPYGTLLINVSGSFVLGLFASLALNQNWSQESRLLVAAGFLGAFTTFSTFSLETLLLGFEGGRWTLALLNTVGNLLLGLFGCGIGLLIGRVAGNLAKGQI